MRSSKITARLKGALCATAALVLLAGCAPDPERREFEFLPDMYRNPALKPQEAYDFLKNRQATLVPPEGALPVGFFPYAYGPAEGERAGEELVNPLPRTMEVLELGRKYYNVHCVVCHGATGIGDGLATLVHREAGMPVPPSLYSDKIRNDWKDGQLYHTIMVGQGNMPAYGQRIDPNHRWAIVHYVRALGVAASPLESDVEEAQRRRWNAAEMDDPWTGRNARDPRSFRSVYPRNSIIPESQEQE